jgi:hypothetical protein
MRHVHWKRIAFWAALWWFVYTAPTEDPFARFRAASTENQWTDFSAATKALQRVQTR